jgi:hypothetical protein
MVGNPPDAPLLAPAIGRVIELCGQVPKSVTADRGYGETKVDDELAALGVKTVVIPRKGRANAERQSSSCRGALASWSSDEPDRKARLAPQAHLGMEPHAHRRNRRCTHLVRVGRARPQRHKDRRARRGTRRKPKTWSTHGPWTMPTTTAHKDPRRLTPSRSLRSRLECRKRQKAGRKLTGEPGLALRRARGHLSGNEGVAPTSTFSGRNR